MSEVKNLELYIHIPFCAKKCNYCDFLSFAASDEDKDRYIAALSEEILKAGEIYSGCNIKTIFIGGGTPSILMPEQFKKICEALRSAFDLSGLKGKEKGFFRKKEVPPVIEFSVECNPGTRGADKLDMMRAMGVNRLSIGLQSAADNELKELGRIHTFQEFVDTFVLARSKGFKNINVDLMQAVPLQTLQSWRKTMAEVVSLKPEHISAYSLIIEEGTPFYDRMHGDFPLVLPDEDEERAIYHATREFLEPVGYKRYEISNYALPGKECRHNIGYWKRENYLGLGLGASSMVDNVRWKNTTDMNEYINGERTRQEEERLSRADQMAEFMFLGLRMTEGISKEKFFETFGQDYDFTYGLTTARLIDDGLMKLTISDSGDSFVSLTEKGIDVSNIVLAEFLPE